MLSFSLGKSHSKQDQYLCRERGVIVMNTSWRLSKSSVHLIRRECLYKWGVINSCHSFFFIKTILKQSFHKKVIASRKDKHHLCDRKVFLLRLSSRLKILIPRLNNNHSLFVRRDCHIYSRLRVVPNFGERQASGRHTRPARDSEDTRHEGSAGK